MAAPPRAKFSTIRAVTSCGNGFTPCAQIPWFPAKTSACATSIRGRGVPCQPAMNTARSSSRPSEPGGFVSVACRSRAAAAAAASGAGRSAAKAATAAASSNERSVIVA